MITSATEAERVSPPPVPVTVSVKEPVDAVEVVLTVKVALPPGDTGFALNDAEAPEGTPLALKETEEVKPLIPETVTGQLVDCPWLTVREAGLAEREKSGRGGAVTVTEADTDTQAVVRVFRTATKV